MEDYRRLAAAARDAYLPGLAVALALPALLLRGSGRTHQLILVALEATRRPDEDDLVAAVLAALREERTNDAATFDAVRHDVTGEGVPGLLRAEAQVLASCRSRR